ncbi:MAG: 3-hydroxy-5-phosphonooxypentane-2,4-dione thiolase, partial [Sphingomonas sp.]|uniref:3-hydroxy-5-phosphonooxypentane-2,4-dione thiolase n=1 Tax=Sphingomonas sp. TaxID=28214 RepID=UPI0025896646
MADASDVKKDAAKSFAVDVPVDGKGFYLKGSAHLGWGMKNRLSRIFDPRSGRTVMLAFDHGYIMGPTSGIERMDLAIPPLIPHADCLMCTRGALQSCMPPEATKPVVLRCGTGATVLKDLSDEVLGVSVEDALRLNAAAITTMVYVGDTHEKESLDNLGRLVDAGNRHGVPTLAVTAVGKDMVRDARYLGLACRVAAELGAHFVKTYYCESGFEEVVAGTPVPIVIAGGKKLPELDALTMAWRAIDQGAAGVDMGRNIFLADSPIAMLQAVRSVVHGGSTPAHAYE